MSQCLSIHPLASHSVYNKTLFVVCLSLLLTTYANAVPVAVPAIAAIANNITPYLVWLFALGGGAIASINGWRLFNGQPKAGVYALGGMVTAGLGFNGIFGTEATTLLI